jgi:poly(A) polymerase
MARRAQPKGKSAVISPEEASPDLSLTDPPHADLAELPPSDLLPPPRHGLVRHDIALDEASIDPDVNRVVRRLTKSGYQAYLVGGCVRDLLLNRVPKDFDVATNAKPEDVRRVFRNCRIIGRRFRLAHVFFPGNKIIEVATFRRSPPQNGDAADADDASDLLIRSDNVYGTLEEDAVRRDFTINGLFYDLESRQILDYFEGVRDIERRAVRTIGDPLVRFREDPVRILRAVKFAGKLDLGIDRDVIDAMLATRDSLALAARPRLFEEILRLMRGGSARRSIFLAWEMGLLHELLPELATMLDDVDGDRGPSARVFRLLSEVDRRTENQKAPFDDVVLWTLLMLEPLLEAVEGERDRSAAAVAFCEPILERLAVTRRIADAMRRIVGALPRLYTGRVGKVSRSELFERAVEVAEISMAARGDATGVDRLKKILAAS